MTPTGFLGFNAPPWVDDAACSPDIADEFYPRRRDEAAAAYALRVCRGCPVRVECLTYARDNGERHGIWGGQRFGRGDSEDGAA